MPDTDSQNCARSRVNRPSPQPTSSARRAPVRSIGLAIDQLLTDGDDMHDREIADFAKIGELLGLQIGEQAPRRSLAGHHRMGRMRQEEGIDLALGQELPEILAVAQKLDLDSLFGR